MVCSNVFVLCRKTDTKVGTTDHVITTSGRRTVNPRQYTGNDTTLGYEG